MKGAEKLSFSAPFLYLERVVAGLLDVNSTTTNSIQCVFGIV
jgi:hypothetical protein